MNIKRRSQLDKIRYAMQDLLTQLEEIRDDEQNALAAMPESFQFGSAGEAMEDAIGNMEEAINSMESAVEYLEEAAA